MSRILVIDDDAAHREYLSVLLGRNGYAVRTLQNGRRLEAALLEGPFAAIITDLYMPEIDGIEILLEMKRLAPSIPVIGVTGGSWASTEACNRAMTSLGAVAMLTKPLDPAAVIAAVQSAVKESSR
jgi:DNA-binding NtrC family response regulator